MTRLWLFLHLLGFTLWMGGSFAAMFAGISAKGEGRAALGAVVRAQAAIQRIMVGPGALLTVLSGLLLTFGIANRLAGFNLWLVVMQGAGLIAALLALFIAVPTASKLAKLDPERSAAHFDELRARQKVVGSIAGVLGLVALLAGTLVRMGG
jgi:hypothetical protein